MDSGLRQCLTPRSVKRSLDRDLETSGKRVSQLRNCLYHVSLAPCGWRCHPSACGPRLYKKRNWTRVSKQASKQSSSEISISISASRVLPLMDCVEPLSQMNPLLPSWVWTRFYHSNRDAIWKTIC